MTRRGRYDDLDIRTSFAESGAVILAYKRIAEHDMYPLASQCG